MASPPAASMLPSAFDSDGYRLGIDRILGVDPGGEVWEGSEMVIVGVGDPKGKDARGGDAARAKEKAKKALVGAGARVLFYPTLFYNVVRNKVEAEFHWWDEVDQFILLGAVPFPADVPRLQQLGVRGVITLNEPYETLVPSSLYKVHGIDHLVIPTRDYLFAPSIVDIYRAVDFIHGNASRRRTTYVHCKAGRGRSTTIVLCYLVEYKNMTPAAALEYVRSRRPRVLLAPSQWRAVEEFSRHKLKFPALQRLRSEHLLTGDELLISEADFEDYSIAEDDETSLMILSNVQEGPIGGDEVLTGDEVFISETDLEGYSIVEYEQTSPIIVKHIQEGSSRGDGDLIGDEVCISETDLEGYSIVENEQTSPMIVKDVQEGIRGDGDVTGDAALISEALLEDYYVVENKDSSPLIVKHVQEGSISGDGDLKGYAALISEATLEDYYIDENKDFSPVTVNHVRDPIGGDEVLITDADLEGHETFTNGSHEKNHSEKRTATAGNSVRWLSCICTSLKFSASNQIQACLALRTSTTMKFPAPAVRCD